MSKKKNGQTEFVKWFGAFVGVLETHQKRRVEKRLFITTDSFTNEAWRIKDITLKPELIDSDKLTESRLDFKTIGSNITH
jgi:hypothetical protein